MRPGESAGAPPAAEGASASAAARNGRLNVAYVAQGGVWLASTDAGK
ncbi:MAG TPA: hypothetical protein VN282_18005 [Pyrinomonadaceae bacterium]|nr:hypothetical protein [Pyrinomonadaceae bacterium]